MPPANSSAPTREGLVAMQMHISQWKAQRTKNPIVSFVPCLPHALHGLPWRQDVTCKCKSPQSRFRSQGGWLSLNRITCTNETRPRYCNEDAACVSEERFLYGNWSVGCKKVNKLSLHSRDPKAHLKPTDSAACVCSLCACRVHCSPSHVTSHWRNGSWL